jgi:RNA polymerase sigma-70 factor, ECF subfamily
VSLPIPIQQVTDLYYEDLYRFAFSLAGQEADARDLTQQTMWVYAKKGESIRDGAKVKSWLLTTLHREFLRHRRKMSRLTSLDPHAEGESESLALALEAATASATTAGDETDAAAILEALHRLDEVLKAPLTLFYLEGLKYREIAEILEVPIGTVMSRLARAKAALRAHFHITTYPLPTV